METLIRTGNTPAALYSTFAPAEAKWIWDRLELHYTHKQGSCLNMTEIELSILVRQCSDRRIADQETLRCETTASEESRNNAQATIGWHFTTANACETEKALSNTETIRIARTMYWLLLFRMLYCQGKEPELSYGIE
jgi:hypothetical protein